MATLTRFVPFRPAFNDFAVLQNRLNSIFQEFAQPAGESGAEHAQLAQSSFVPAVDVYEDPQKLTLHVEAPGIKPEAIDVRIENRVLTIRGERKLDNDVKEENFHRIERRYGSFVRTFTLPSTVDTDSVQATAENGVLTLTFARKAEAKPRQIEVKVNAPALASNQTQPEAQTQPRTIEAEKAA